MGSLQHGLVVWVMVGYTYVERWQLIYQRLKSIGELDRLKSIKAPKNWSAGIRG